MRSKAGRRTKSGGRTCLSPRKGAGTRAKEGRKYTDALGACIHNRGVRLTVVY